MYQKKIFKTHSISYHFNFKIHMIIQYMLILVKQMPERNNNIFYTIQDKLSLTNHYVTDNTGQKILLPILYDMWIVATWTNHRVELQSLNTFWWRTWGIPTHALYNHWICSLSPSTTDASLYRVPDKKDMITRQKQPNKTARRTDIKYVVLQNKKSKTVFSRTCLFTVHILIVADSTNDDLGHPPQTSKNPILSI